MNVICRHCGKNANEYHRDICAKWNKELCKSFVPFDKLPWEERKDYAFKVCGCEYACPTWWMLPSGGVKQVECLHTKCQIRRGEKPPIYEAESVLDSERSNGWLRFLDEEVYQNVYKAIIAKCEELKIYDPWELPGGWQMMVRCGVSGKG